MAERGVDPGFGAKGARVAGVDGGAESGLGRNRVGNSQQREGRIGDKFNLIGELIVEKRSGELYPSPGKKLINSSSAFKEVMS